MRMRIINAVRATTKLIQRVLEARLPMAARCPGCVSTDDGHATAELTSVVICSRPGTPHLWLK